MRCAIYTRKSTVKGLEQEFNTLDAQREAGEHYVRAHAADGWEVLTTKYDDGGHTGANTDRPAFQRLLADIRAGEVDAVVAYKLDRITRSLLDFARLLEEFEKYGVDLVLVTQNFSTADPVGRLTLNMLMAFAQFEREQTAQRTRDKKAATILQGRWSGGKPPYGYQLVDGQLVIQEAEAAVVRRMFQRYPELRATRSVAADANERGYTTQRIGQTWKSTGRAWDAASVQTLLRRPVYAGFLTLEGELVQGIHAPIVERADFDEVQALLRSQNRDKDRGGRRNADYLLRGLVTCASCGAAMSPHGTGSANRRYRYYRCTSAAKRGAGACAGGHVRAPALEDAVALKVEEWALESDVSEAVLARLKTRMGEERKRLEEDRGHHQAALADLRVRLQRVGAAVATTDGAAADDLLTQHEALREKVAAREDELAQTLGLLDKLTAAAVDAEWVHESLADFRGLWPGMSSLNRARLIASVVDGVVWDGSKGTAEVNRRTLAPVGRTE